MSAHPKSLVVVGAGPGGYPAAFRAADLGMDVTLVDKEPNPGGVCLYRGCIPSKTLLHAAAFLNEAREAEGWGISVGEIEVDIDKLRDRKQAVIDRLTGGLGQLSKARKIRRHMGKKGRKTKIWFVGVSEKWRDHPKQTVFFNTTPF